MKTATAVSGPENFETIIRIGDHQLVTDAPTESGGRDLGPEPHDLLAAALAGCTRMTLQMYARRKGWEFGSLEVSVSTRRESDGSTVFTREIVLGSAPLSEEQRARLIHIANACPVHKMLQNAVRIETTPLS